MHFGREPPMRSFETASPPFVGTLILGIGGFTAATGLLVMFWALNNTLAGGRTGLQLLDSRPFLFGAGCGFGGLLLVGFGAAVRLLAEIADLLKQIR